MDKEDNLNDQTNSEVIYEENKLFTIIFSESKNNNNKTKPITIKQWLLDEGFPEEWIEEDIKDSDVTTYGLPNNKELKQNFNL
jgi:hypothetical protein